MIEKQFALDMLKTLTSLFHRGEGQAASKPQDADGTACNERNPSLYAGKRLACMLPAYVLHAILSPHLVILTHSTCGRIISMTKYVEAVVSISMLSCCSSEK